MAQTLPLRGWVRKKLRRGECVKYTCTFKVKDVFMANSSTVSKGINIESKVLPGGSHCYHSLVYHLEMTWYFCVSPLHPMNEDRQ